ncbi:4-hydroxybenzoyl-CoA thioesterase [Nocardioides gansuensis]|uniref:4-hydroxybenzoyl-CoA thioesterase n=1 Tax=Nocardioides gansuensis TaxID=2138300 RepID=A0A2T8F4J2_9ACTN|nr:thioesterase family protein [Nocardioides gansuensis]PVG80620.1 4-hydroxybenzoyl-CoA thioesterase [Nocardioides gansuensis]
MTADSSHPLSDRAVASALSSPSSFPVRWPVTTRWADNDMFGHLNNAVYYQLFDTAINGWIATELSRDPMTSRTTGVVAESGCRFLAEVRFPSPLTVGLAVTRLGRSSVTYQLGLIDGQGEDAEVRQPTVAAVGHWVHVYVDRESGRPVSIPPGIRALLATAQRTSAAGPRGSATSST